MGMLEDATRDYAKYDDRTTDPGTPDSGTGLVYLKGGQLHTIDDAGVAVAYGSTSSTVSTNVQTAPYTLVLSDAGKAVEMDVATANNLTVPPNSAVAFPTGTIIEVCQVGAGTTTIVADTGVTVRTPETLVLSGQWSSVSLRKRATDEWVLAGDVVAA